MNLICFDLEGPMSPQDNAYELMKLFPGGDKVFETISRYDDLLALEGRPGYEPGDTLALIAPFLVYHKITEKDINGLARKATLTNGASDLISKLSARSWRVFCITTTYEQYALHLTQRLSIFSQYVACTRFPLDEISTALAGQDLGYLKAIEDNILRKYPADDDWIKGNLDDFYWSKLPNTELGPALTLVRPMGGQHKVEALQRFAQTQNQPLSGWVVVGDSITDSKMLQAVDKAGGLAIVFNANKYALPYATVGLASASIFDLWPVLEIWKPNKRPAVERLVKSKEKLGGRGDRDYFQWLPGIGDFTAPLEVHTRIRHIVREEAARLG